MGTAQANILTAPEMIRTLKKLAAMDTDYKLYPGHDSETTLFYEKKYNQFMRF